MAIEVPFYTDLKTATEIILHICV